MGRQEEWEVNCLRPLDELITGEEGANGLALSTAFYPKGLYEEQPPLNRVVKRIICEYGQLNRYSTEGK